MNQYQIVCPCCQGGPCCQGYALPKKVYFTMAFASKNCTCYAALFPSATVPLTYFDNGSGAPAWQGTLTLNVPSDEILAPATSLYAGISMACVEYLGGFQWQWSYGIGGVPVGAPVCCPPGVVLHPLNECFDGETPGQMASFVYQGIFDDFSCSPFYLAGFDQPSLDFGSACCTGDTEANVNGSLCPVNVWITT